MTTYVYETIPQCECDEIRCFEIKQSMKDAALTHHPETGEPIRRRIQGGYGLITKEAAVPAPRHACGNGCCCHAN